MVFFSLFVISAVIIGAGAMLAPAWPSSAPRIGLSATLLLGIVSGGAVWWTELFGWDTLIIDYLLFAIVSGVILGGTLSKGGENSEAGWPSRRELLFFGLVALVCMMPFFVLRLPLGERAASNALFTLSIQQASNIPEPYLGYAFAPPAFHALAAYLSQQLRQNVPTIHMALGSLIAFLCVWTVFDLGAEIRDKRLGYAMAIILLVSFGMLSLLWQSYYSQLMGVLFAFAFTTYALRYYRQHKWKDMIAAGLMLGAVLYCSPILFALCLSGYYLLILFMALPFRRASKQIAQWTIYSRLGLWFGILAVCLFGTGIWLLRNWNSLQLHYFGDSFIYHTEDSALWMSTVYTLASCILLSYALSWLTRQFELSRRVYWFIALFVLAVGVTTFYLRETLPQVSSENDLAAMRWIADNTPEDAVIINYYSVDALWVMFVSERATVYPPLMPGSDEYTCGYACSQLNAFWNDPAKDISLLQFYFVNYVIVPDGLEFPHEIEGLRLVFEQGGARVYEVIREE
jgi:hypothetical protein